MSKSASCTLCMTALATSDKDGVLGVGVIFCIIERCPSRHLCQGIWFAQLYDQARLHFKFRPLQGATRCALADSCHKREPVNDSGSYHLGAFKLRAQQHSELWAWSCFIFSARLHPCIFASTKQACLILYMVPAYLHAYQYQHRCTEPTEKNQNLRDRRRRNSLESLHQRHGPNKKSKHRMSNALKKLKDW